MSYFETAKHKFDVLKNKKEKRKNRGTPKVKNENNRRQRGRVVKAVAC